LLQVVAVAFGTIVQSIRRCLLELRAALFSQHLQKIQNINCAVRFRITNLSTSAGDIRRTLRGRVRAITPVLKHLQKIQDINRPIRLSTAARYIRRAERIVPVHTSVQSELQSWFKRPVARVRLVRNAIPINISNVIREQRIVGRAM